jgi:hypothetical protein
LVVGLFPAVIIISRKQLEGKRIGRHKIKLIDSEIKN